MHENPGRAVHTEDICVAGKLINKPVLYFLKILMVLCALIQMPHAIAQDVRVSAQLSASTITRDESVTLTITAIGIDAELDASSLDADFDVVGRSSSRRVSSVIGANNRAVNTSVVTWALELLPRKQGVFTVPAVKVGNYDTQLLTLTVSDVPQGANRDVFVEASVDTTSPWVQSQVLMTLKVFQGIEIIDGGLDIPAADDLVVERLGEDTRERVLRDGREYSVTERRFAVFPQKSGSLTIDPVTLNVTIPAQPERVRGFFSPTRKLTRRSEPVTLEVQARPPSGTAWWLPATSLTLTSEWKGDPESAQVDQPLTRTLIMRAEGVLQSQLPEINIPAIEGVSLYAEDPDLSMGGTDKGLVAEQRINWALIPQRSGTLNLPAIKLEWFNTLTGQIETAELPEETITVMAASANTSAVQSNTGTVSEPSSTALSGGSPDNTLASLSDSGSMPSANGTDINSLPATDITSLPLGAGPEGLRISRLQWQMLAAAALALWLITLLAWFVSHRRSSAVAGASSDAGKSRGHATRHDQIVSMSHIDKACREGDLVDIKHAVLDWAERQWPENSPNTLGGLQAKLPHGAAHEKLSVIQSALYSKRGYLEKMAMFADDTAGLSRDLKAAMQQSFADAGVNNNDVSSAKGRTKLPPL